MNWRRLWHGHQQEEKLDRELSFHIEARVKDLVSGGLPEQEARRIVQLEFGRVAHVKEDVRYAWGWMWLDQLRQDLCYAFRTMADNRLFTFLAVVSLALGIGANTTIYSFLDSILLRSLPVSQPESLVTLNWNSPPPANYGQGKGPREPAVVRLAYQSSLSSSYIDPRQGTVATYFPYAAFELFQHEDTPFQNVFAYMGGGALNMQANGTAEVVEGNYVSGGYFEGLRVAPAVGRLVAPDDDRSGAPTVAVLSHSYWTQRFGGSAEAVGKTILVNNTPVTIVGVTPPGFFGVDAEANPDLFLPLHSNVALNAGTPMAGVQGWYTNPNFYWVEMMARLKPGVNAVQAQAAMAPRFRDFVASTANTEEERAVLPALLLKQAAGGMDGLRRQYSKPLYLLMALVGLMLAIACANIANLLLARSAARKREIAVRLSMGASRGRVVRQLLTESVLLASTGGVLGALLAIGGIRFLTGLLSNGSAHFTLRAELNWHVLLVTAGLSMLGGVFFGLAPSLRSTRGDLMPALKEVRTSYSGTRRRGWFRVNLGQTLIAGQVAFSLLILVAAGLFVRTLSNLESVPLGFNKGNLLLFGVNLREAGVAVPEMPQFHEELRERLSRVPGVRGATYSNLSLVGGGSMSIGITVPGRKEARAAGLYVGPSFLETMQIRISQGRTFNDSDRKGTPRVAVVNELFAKTYFAGQNAIGQTFTPSDGPDPIEIVGVSVDTRYGRLKDDPQPAVYLAMAQAGQRQTQGTWTYELRTAGDPLLLVNSVREAIRQVNEHITPANIRTQAGQIDRTINREILFASLCTAFAVVALAIASVGLYGTTAYNVTRRTGEIGIRMALGAQRPAVAWMVLREVFLLAVLGVAISVPAALATTKFVESFLFNMQPNDPAAFVAAGAVLLGAALLAAYVPARRASRVDPMVALRHE